MKNLGLANEKKLTPRGQIAIKFPAPGSMVTIKGIELSFEGKLYASLVATFEPVEIAGAVVARASLKSFKWVSDKSYRENYFIKKGMSAEFAGTGSTVGIGSICTLTRQGDIIPFIGTVVNNFECDEFPAPTECPHCGSEVKADEANYYCVNMGCEAKEAARISDFLALIKVKGLAWKSLVTQYTNRGITQVDFMNPERYSFIRDTVAMNGGSVAIWDKISAQLKERLGS